jgi:hypothetical protein
LLKELSFSFIRSGGDDAPSTREPWIRLSHDPERTAGSRRARSSGAVFGRLRDTSSLTQTSSQLYAGYRASMIARSYQTPRTISLEAENGLAVNVLL